MKKHQLLEKAMRDYPAGTRFTFYSEKFEFSYTSTGVFVCWKDDYNKEAHKDSIWRVNEHGDPSGMVYDGLSKKWAEIVKPSILTGKCAIQVNNEREFKLLMEHYESKGLEWSNIGGRSILKDLKFPYSISYENDFTWAKDCDYEDVKIIPFAEFAAEVGIKVPEFVMTSEDGVDLYVGGLCWVPQTDLTGNLKGHAYKLSVIIGWANYEGSAKFFSTKEAAEAWILEANKPKEIVIQVEHDQQIIVRDNGFEHKENGTYVYQLKGSLLEKAYEAYKSLQP